MRRFSFVCDLVVVVVFVAIGRHTHDRHSSFNDFLRILWPFALSVLLASLVVRRTMKAKTAVAQGAVIAIVTTAVAMALRVLSGQGTAIAFIIVSLVFLGAAMIGWRWAFERWTRSSGAARGPK